MTSLALNALGEVSARAEYADVRIVETRERHVATKNGKAGSVGSSESLGLGVRVLVNGCWGFAATDDLSSEGIRTCAARALAIAQASGLARKEGVVLAPE